MLLDLFNFSLPESLIALTPPHERSAAKMLLVKSGGGLEDSAIEQLPDYLNFGDVLVLNNSKVMPARLRAKRGEANIELLLHQPFTSPLASHAWLAFARPAKRLQAGDVLILPNGAHCELLEKREDGQLVLDMQGVAATAAGLLSYLNEYGEIPLPPYIEKKRVADAADTHRYQTVYARDDKQASVAAPTAGLHFTPELLARIRARGVEIAYVTLHVGAGTFQPVKVADTDGHQMHHEYAEIDSETAALIARTKAAGGRVVAVGTTTVRVLETAAAQDTLKAFSGWTNIFITPGYRFRVVDALLTNFHLPKSTLFMLVCAFSGREQMLNAYHHAMHHSYRFYSYGDACLLVKGDVETCKYHHDTWK